jgi:hypothetical protein
MESQLASLNDLVRNLRPGEAYVAESDRDDRHRQDHQPENSFQGEHTDVTIEEAPGSWESIKKQILGDAPVAQDLGTEDRELLRQVSQTPCPREIDLNTAGVDELKQAIDERDGYIMQLNRLIRMRNSLAVPVDWASLANVPAEMQVRVETLIERLDVQVRLGEVEMSLERARIAREKSQVQAEREHIEKHLRRLGLNSLADLDSISAAPASANDRRWMRFLGTGPK